VDQSHGLQRLPWIFLGHLGGDQFPQFVVDERQELHGGRTVALLDPRENPCHVVRFAGWITWFAHRQGRIELIPGGLTT
jgi:hypothetical protein